MRAATPDDAAQIAQIHRLARAKAMPWLPVIHPPEDELDYFARTVLPQEQVRVIDRDGQIAGFVAFQDAWLNHLYIHPKLWRTGLGSMLLAEAQTAAPSLQVWTFEQNTPARHFYIRHGFQEAERTNGHRNEEKTPDVRLIWTRPVP